MIRNSSTPIKRSVEKNIKSDYQTTLNKKKLQQISKIARSKQKKSIDKLNQSPRFVRSSSQLYKGSKGQRQESKDRKGSIVKHLDEKDTSHIHKYKQLKNHSKKSDFNQVTAIIQQLLNKHALQKKLSLSEQYILTGYMGKFAEQTKDIDYKKMNNPFNIIERIQTKNSINSAQKSQSENFKTPKSASKNQYNKKISPVEEKRGFLNKQFQKLRFLWQMYQLKCIVCPQINKISEFNQADYQKSMMEIVIRLKTIQRNKSKIGQQKSLSQLQKVMRSFQQAIRKGLC